MTKVLIIGLHSSQSQFPSCWMENIRDLHNPDMIDLYVLCTDENVYEQLIREHEDNKKLNNIIIEYADEQNDEAIWAKHIKPKSGEYDAEMVVIWPGNVNIKPEDFDTLIHTDSEKRLVTAGNIRRYFKSFMMGGSEEQCQRMMVDDFVQRLEIETPVITKKFFAERVFPERMFNQLKPPMNKPTWTYADMLDYLVEHKGCDSKRLKRVVPHKGAPYWEEK